MSATTTYPGRVEAKIVVPTGGAAVSASNGARSAATTVTVPAGNYYLTAAGGVSSLLTTVQSQLNQNVQGYPDNTTAMQQSVGGYGQWTAGWLCNESSGNLIAAFGGVNLTPANSPTYGAAGPMGGVDLAVGFSGTTSTFSGGDNFDVTGTSDIVIAWVGKIIATPGASRDVLGKYSGGDTHRWLIYHSTTAFAWNINDSVTNIEASVTAMPVGEWHVGMAVLDRGANQIRIGIRSLTSGITTVSAAVNSSAVGDMSNAVNFTLGNQLFGADSNLLLSAVYVGVGTGAAASMSANLGTALLNFGNAVTSTYSCALSTTDGRITISNSFWPSSVSWTNTTLRDVLGYAYDFDYPQTPAQMAVAAGLGTWTNGIGYSCNEASGNIASTFGTPASMTANGAGITYSKPGPRGGADKAVNITGNSWFDGGANMDVVGTDDLFVVWVGRFTSATVVDSQTVLTKVSAAFADGWSFSTTGTTSFQLAAKQTAGTFRSSAISNLLPGEWHVALGVVDRGANVLRFGIQGLTSGTQVLGAAAAPGADNFTTTAALRYGASAWTSASCSQFEMGQFFVVKGASVASGVAASFATVLSTFSTYMKSQTSTKQARGLWFPDCPPVLGTDPYQTPLASDKRGTESPTGNMISLVGNWKYRTKGLVFSHSPQDRVWESAVTYANASYEQFLKDTQLGKGLSWFVPGSRVQVYYDRAGVQTLLGGAANSGAGLSGWFVKNIDSIEPTLSVSSYNQLYRIEWPELGSDG